MRARICDLYDPQTRHHGSATGCPYSLCFLFSIVPSGLTTCQLVSVITVCELRFGLLQVSFRKEGQMCHAASSSNIGEPHKGRLSLVYGDGFQARWLLLPGILPQYKTWEDDRLGGWHTNFLHVAVCVCSWTHLKAKPYEPSFWPIADVLKPLCRSAPDVKKSRSSWDEYSVSLRLLGALTPQPDSWGLCIQILTGRIWAWKSQ